MLGDWAAQLDYAVYIGIGVMEVDDSDHVLSFETSKTHSFNDLGLLAYTAIRQEKEDNPILYNLAHNLGEVA